MPQVITGTRDAQMTMYREEYIAGFERGGSVLRQCVTTEHQKKGNTVQFLVADTGNATAVTRGSDGNYPARANNNNQIPLVLRDYTDLPRMNDFDIFSSQGPQREIMYKGSIEVIGRAIDDVIITTLDTATGAVNDAGTTDALGLLHSGIAALGNVNAGVLKPGDHTALITPGFYTNLLKTKEFSSKEYVDVTRVINGIPVSTKMLQYLGVNLIVHTGLSGIGTATEKCFIFHRNAVGHAIDKDQFSPLFGFNEEQNYSWVRATVYQGGAKLQNAGILEMYHDGSGFATVAAL